MRSRKAAAQVVPPPTFFMALMAAAIDTEEPRCVFKIAMYFETW